VADFFIKARKGHGVQNPWPFCLNEEKQVGVCSEERLNTMVVQIDSDRVVALNTPAELKQMIPTNTGKEPIPEDIFRLEVIFRQEDGFQKMTGKKLVNPEKEESLP
jgi:hypothetical protein